MPDTLRKQNMRLRVLVVDDERRLRELILRELPEMNAIGVGAADAEEALAVMRDDGADVVLLDLHLPRIDGMSFFDTLRARWPDTPVIILTAFGTLESAQRAIRHNVVDYLRKPCHLGEIEASLGRARARIIERSGRFKADRRASSARSTSIEPAPMRLEAIQKQAIFEAIERAGGNRTAAAQALGISRRTLYNRLRAYEMEAQSP